VEQAEQAKKCKRLDLTVKAVEEAVDLAVKGSEGITDYCDLLQPYLVLRVRGHSASWLVKTRFRTLKIGDAMPPAMSARLPKRRKRGSIAAREYIGLRKARGEAKREWAALDVTPVAPLNRRRGLGAILRRRTRSSSRKFAKIRRAGLSIRPRKQ
jgi:hypothetical protein